MVSRGRRGRLRDEPEQRRQQRRDGDGLAGVLVAGALLVLGPGVADAATGGLELLAHAHHQRLVVVVARVGGLAPARRLLRIVPRRHCTGTLERAPLDTAGRVRARTAATARWTERRRSRTFQPTRGAGSRVLKTRRGTGPGPLQAPGR